MMRVRHVAAIGLVLTALIGQASVADAHYGFSGSGLYIPDSADHWFCFDSSVPGGDRQPYYDAMDYLDNSTDLYDQSAGSCASDTDVVYIRNDNLLDGNGQPIRGIAQCVWVDTFVCRAYWVGVNYFKIFTDSVANDPGDSTNYEVNIWKTIRHETGHTTGMWHLSFTPQTPCGSDGVDAMESGWVSTDGAWLVFVAYNNHHVCHVNNQF